jgi:hypothetical protein
MTTRIAVTKKQKASRRIARDYAARMWAATDDTGSIPRWLASAIIGQRGAKLETRLSEIERWGLRLPVLTDDRKPHGAIIPAKAERRETSIFAGFEQRSRGDDYPQGLTVRFNGTMGGKVLWLVL